MAVVIHSKTPAHIQEFAKKIIQTLLIDNLKVHFEEKPKLIVFEQDRRVVSIPVHLVEEEKWQDIRFLFRSILESPNNLWNHAADGNDWSGTNHYKNE